MSEMFNHCQVVSNRNLALLDFEVFILLVKESKQLLSH